MRKSEETLTKEISSISVLKTQKQQKSSDSMVNLNQRMSKIKASLTLEGLQEIDEEVAKREPSDKTKYATTAKN